MKYRNVKSTFSVNNFIGVRSAKYRTFNILSETLDEAFDGSVSQKIC